MKTIKVIDLLNKIANGEEVPNRVRFDNIEWNRVYGEKNVYYIDEYDNDLFIHFFRKNLDFTLNDEVEIKAEKKEDKPITKESIEALGYACGEIKKLFESGWNKSIENKPLEEEKKIPEKLPDIRFENGKFYLPINDKQMYILREIDKVFLDKINSIIDYLKSKGE